MRRKVPESVHSEVHGRDREDDSVKFPIDELHCNAKAIEVDNRGKKISHILVEQIFSRTFQPITGRIHYIAVISRSKSQTHFE